MRDLERQLVSEEAWVNRPRPTVTEPAPSESYPRPFADRSDSIGRAKVLFQLAKLAVQTDSTRVVSIFIRGMDEKPDQLAWGVTRHLLTYATGQPATPLDQSPIEAIMKGSAKDDYGLRSLVHGIVQSETECDTKFRAQLSGTGMWQFRKTCWQ